MNSTLKVIVPILLVIGLVFGATFVSMYTGDAGNTDATTDPTSAIVGPPLLFDTTRVGFDPQSTEQTTRNFPGYFEPGESLIQVWFWFKNPYKVPVKVGVLHRSCSACTSARIAVLESPGSRAYAARASLVGGPAAFMPNLSWKALDFDKPEETVEVPAAISDDEPTWGLFEMAIKVRGIGPNTLSVDVGLTAPNASPTRMTFHVTIVGVPPFNTTPNSLNFGQLTEGTPAQTRTLHYWSATRELADLPPPGVAVNVKDPYLQVGTPVALTREELDRMMVGFAAEGKPVRIVSGYKMPVTMHRKLPAPVPNFPDEPDIGPYDRQIGITGPAGTTATITVASSIVGLVGLADGSSVDLKDFESRFGTEKTVNLVSDRLDLTMEPIPGEFRPRFLEVAIGEPTTESGRRYWALKVIVPKGALRDELPNDSVLVFRAKTPTGTYKVRIPVKGRAFDRGK